MTILDEILTHKRREVAAWKAAGRPPIPHPTSPPSFETALRAAPLAVIAEVKRCSPSAGILRDPFDPPAIARAYAAGGAAAISVLMDERYFGGGEIPFRAVRDAVSLPLLYKEFVVDEWQICQARALGASAVLLIATALDDGDLRRFRAAAEDEGLTALVEVHDAVEMARAVECGARVIGINNRDLRTFRTDLAVTEQLAADAPPDALLVSESGIQNARDVARLYAAGVRAILVGEHLLRQADLASAVRSLRSAIPPPAPAPAAPR